MFVTVTVHGPAVSCLAGCKHLSSSDYLLIIITTIGDLAGLYPDILYKTINCIYSLYNYEILYLTLYYFIWICSVYETICTEPACGEMIKIILHEHV